MAVPELPEPVRLVAAGRPTAAGGSHE